MTKNRNKYLVSTNWLGSQLGNPELRIIDASWYLPDLSRSPHREYDENHITGASFFDLDEFSDQNASLPHMALDPESFAKKIEVFGISTNCTVVVYDGSGIFSAARLLWLFHLYGFSNAFILDGGFPKWLSENRSTDSKIKIFEKSHFPISYKDELVVDLNQVRGSIESSDVQIVDARQRAGINLEKRLITSCGSGVTAAILYIVFKGLGAKRVSVYDGSWCEWGSVNHLKF